MSERSHEQIPQPQKPKDLYEILGINKDASPAEIKRAFRTHAKELHPDITGENPEKTMLFKHIKDAYEVLGDPEQRTRYDAKRKNATGSPSLQKQETSAEHLKMCEAEFVSLIEDEGKTTGFFQAMVKARHAQGIKKEEPRATYLHLVTEMLNRHRIPELQKSTYLSRFEAVYANAKKFIASLGGR